MSWWRHHTYAHTLQHYESFPHFPFFSPPLSSEQLPQSLSPLADAVSHQRHNFLHSFFPLKASCIETEVKCLWLICEKWYLWRINQRREDERVRLGWSWEKKETTEHNLPSTRIIFRILLIIMMVSFLLPMFFFLSLCLSVISVSFLHTLCLSFPFIKPLFFVPYSFFPLFPN